MSTPQSTCLSVFCDRFFASSNEDPEHFSAPQLGRRAKYYRLTPAGRRQLAVEAGEWDRMSTAIGRVMKLA